MTLHKTVSEETGFTSTVIFQPATAVPSSLKYRVDCETTSKELVGWTPVTPASRYTLTMLPEWSKVLSGAPYEFKTVTWKWDESLNTQGTKVYRWRVNEAPGVE